MIEKVEKYWNATRGIMAVATVLDPRFKMKFIECFFPEIYRDGASSQIARVCGICYDLVKEYEAKSKLGGDQNHRFDDAATTSSSWIEVT